MFAKPLLGVLTREDANLAMAAAHVAKAIAYPNLDLAAIDKEVDRLVFECAQHLPVGETPAGVGLALSKALFRKLRFRGNHGDYTDPHNSFINHVLDRRTGIPLTLSIVYLVVAERLAIDADGISMPGHFIVRINDPEQPVFIDPYHSGVQLTLRDCDELVRATTGYRGRFQSAWLEPVAPDAMIARMLRNLRSIYLQRAQWQPAGRAIQLLQALEPAEPRHLRDLGLVRLQMGEKIRGYYLLEQYLQDAPQATDADELRRGLRDQFDLMAQLN